MNNESRKAILDDIDLSPGPGAEELASLKPVPNNDVVSALNAIKSQNPKSIKIISASGKSSSPYHVLVHKPTGSLIGDRLGLAAFFRHELERHQDGSINANLNQAIFDCDSIPAFTIAVVDAKKTKDRLYITSLDNFAKQNKLRLTTDKTKSRRTPDVSGMSDDKEKGEQYGF